MIALDKMQAAFEAAYPAASRARRGDGYGGAFDSMFIVWQAAVASASPQKAALQRLADSAQEMGEYDKAISDALGCGTGILVGGKHVPYLDTLAPAPVEQVDALTDVTPLLYYRADADGSICWDEDCVCADPVYDHEDSTEQRIYSGKAYSEAQVRTIIAATRQAGPVQHDSDCSTNNGGVPELLGPCDCEPEPTQSQLDAGCMMLLSCTASELESYSQKLLDGYEYEVRRIYRAMRKAAPVQAALENACVALKDCYEIADYPADGSTLQDKVMNEGMALLTRKTPK